MAQAGIRLTLLLGRAVPAPAPLELVQALDSLEVIHGERAPSGLQMIFRTGRGGARGRLDFPLAASPLLRPWSRVIAVVSFGLAPQVLFDGFLTHHQLAPSESPGGSRLTVTGEDVSVMMDLEERSEEHPAQDETAIAFKLIGRYAQHGLRPEVIPPLALDPPIPVERVPVQQGTDREYLLQIAERHGHVFYVTPGPLPGASVAYWGPPVRTGVPQSALTVNQGSLTNVASLDFEYDALAPSLVAGRVQDRTSNQATAIRTATSFRVPPLAREPALTANAPSVRSTQLRASGLNAVQAQGRAQATTDASTDRVVVARGELDTLRYGGVLRARGLVGVRGAGLTYDGLYRVGSVTHRIRSGAYTQSFTLAREGVGTLTPAVSP